MKRKHLKSCIPVIVMGNSVKIAHVDDLIEWKIFEQISTGVNILSDQYFPVILLVDPNFSTSNKKHLYDFWVVIYIMSMFVNEWNSNN